jgi:hypothetical protein
MGDGFDTRLLTAEGHFVTRARIPLFKRPPEIVRWGERFFVCRLNGEYREAMGLALRCQSREPRATRRIIAGDVGGPRFQVRDAPGALCQIGPGGSGTRLGWLGGADAFARYNDLGALIAGGRGDVPLIKTRWRCGNCGSLLTDFVVPPHMRPVAGAGHRARRRRLHLVFDVHHGHHRALSVASPA